MADRAALHTTNMTTLGRLTAGGAHGPRGAGAGKGEGMRSGPHRAAVVAEGRARMRESTTGRGIGRHPREQATHLTASTDAARDDTAPRAASAWGARHPLSIIEDAEQFDRAMTWLTRALAVVASTCLVTLLVWHGWLKYQTPGWMYLGWGALVVAVCGIILALEARRRG